jgi:predicted transport protein
MIVKKDPKMINAGKKAAVTRKLANHSLNTHQDKTVAELWSVFEELKEFILDLDSSIQEVPKQYYIAYKTSQNFASIEFLMKSLKIFLKVNPKNFKHIPNKTRDVTNIGHKGTGNLECTISSLEDLKWVKGLIKMSFDNIGG